MKYIRKSKISIIFWFDLVKNAKRDAKKDVETYNETRRELNVQKETKVNKLC